MNEEEIMLVIKDDCARFSKSKLEAIQGLLDLYQKEKEKNKKYQRIEKGTTIIYKSKAKYVREDRIEKYYIDKNKIREKIKELEQFQEQHKEGTWGDIPIEDYDFDKINLLKELLGE